MDTTSPDTIADGIKEIMSDILDSVDTVGLDEDLFHAGLDSLLAFKTIRRIRSSLREFTIDSAGLEPRIIYANPTI
jgi:aryl carrier-like protein